MNGSTGCVSALLGYGSDIEIVNRQGMKAHQLAIQAGHRELANLVLKHKDHKKIPVSPSEAHLGLHQSPFSKTSSTSNINSSLMQPPKQILAPTVPLPPPKQLEMPSEGN
jgi:ankyrin repeat protein